MHRRSSHSSDRLRWYCKNPDHAEPTIIYEESMHVTDLVSGALRNFGALY